MIILVYVLSGASPIPLPVEPFVAYHMFYEMLFEVVSLYAWLGYVTGRAAIRVR